MITDSDLYIKILWVLGDDILIYLSIDGRPAEGSQLLHFLLCLGAARITKHVEEDFKKGKKKKSLSVVLFHLFSQPTNQHQTSIPAFQLHNTHRLCCSVFLSRSLARSPAHARSSPAGRCRYCHHCCHVA